MASFATIANVVPLNPRGPKAVRRLHEAYVNFYAGRPSVEDCQLVITDLAKFSGYYNTTSPDASDATVRFSEGQRSVFGRIMILANPSRMTVDQIQQAVEEEMKTDEG